MIDIEKVSTILKLLLVGQMLRVDYHKVVYLLKMNPQRNRICVTLLDGTDDLCGFDPESAIIWGLGDWSLVVKEPSQKLVPVNVPGEYRAI